jgi:hypothetical protein
MALGTGGITLQQIATEVGLGATTNLIACITAAKAYGLNPTYGIHPITSMEEFRGYDHSAVITAVSLGHHISTSGTACTNFGTPTTRYRVGGTTFTNCTSLYTTVAGTQLAPTNYYSDGGNWRF